MTSDESGQSDQGSTGGAPSGLPAEPAPTGGGWAPAATPKETAQPAPDPDADRGDGKDAPRVDPGVGTD